VKWRRGAGTDQVEDRRGMGMGVPAVGGGLGIVGLLVVLLVNVLGGGGTGGIDIPALGPVDSGQPGSTIPADDDAAQFAAFVIDDVQRSWAQVFSDSNKSYEQTDLILYTGATSTGCGQGSAGMGPFYCASDANVYIDLDFYRELATRFGAPGDFAQAYVIAHEVGHHVQNLLGISNQVSSREDGINLELQADCFAGVWGHAAETEGILEPGDVEEGLGAAAAVGDDRLQEQAKGSVNPDTFTHGTSAQRMQWFRTGFESGDPNSCDTFG
jgi:predicted metalloprotease